MDLADRHCKRLPKGTPPLGPAETQQLANHVPSWRIEDGQLARDFEFRDFRCALDFLVRAAVVAETEQHHPDLHLTGYRKVRIGTTTHSVGGLSENDFILAARIDRLPEKAA